MLWVVAPVCVCGGRTIGSVAEESGRIFGECGTHAWAPMRRKRVMGRLYEINGRERMAKKEGGE